MMRLRTSHPSPAVRLTLPVPRDIDLTTHAPQLYLDGRAVPTQADVAICAPVAESDVWRVRVLDVSGVAVDQGLSPFGSEWTVEWVRPEELADEMPGPIVPSECLAMVEVGSARFVLDTRTPTRWTRQGPVRWTAEMRAHGEFEGVNMIGWLSGWAGMPGAEYTILVTPTGQPRRDFGALLWDLPRSWSVLDLMRDGPWPVHESGVTRIYRGWLERREREHHQYPAMATCPEAWSNCQEWGPTGSWGPSAPVAASTPGETSGAFRALLERRQWPDLRDEHGNPVGIQPDGDWCPADIPYGGRTGSGGLHVVDGLHLLHDPSQVAVLDLLARQHRYAARQPDVGEVDADGWPTVPRQRWWAPTPAGWSAIDGEHLGRLAHDWTAAWLLGDDASRWLCQARGNAARLWIDEIRRQNAGSRQPNARDTGWCLQACVAAAMTCRTAEAQREWRSWLRARQLDLLDEQRWQRERIDSPGAPWGTYPATHRVGRDVGYHEAVQAISHGIMGAGVKALRHFFRDTPLRHALQRSLELGALFAEENFYTPGKDTAHAALSFPDAQGFDPRHWRLADMHFGPMVAAALEGDLGDDRVPVQAFASAIVRSGANGKSAPHQVHDLVEGRRRG